MYILEASYMKIHCYEYIALLLFIFGIIIFLQCAIYTKCAFVCKDEYF